MTAVPGPKSLPDRWSGRVGKGLRPTGPLSGALSSLDSTSTKVGTPLGFGMCETRVEHVSDSTATGSQMGRLARSWRLPRSGGTFQDPDVGTDIRVGEGLSVYTRQLAQESYNLVATYSSTFKMRLDVGFEEQGTQM